NCRGTHRQPSIHNSTFSRNVPQIHLNIDRSSGTYTTSAADIISPGIQSTLCFLDPQSHLDPRSIPNFPLLNLLPYLYHPARPFMPRASRSISTHRRCPHVAEHIMEIRVANASYI